VYKRKFTCTILINGEKQHGNITVYKMKLIHVILTILNLYKMKTIQLSKEKINSIEKHPKTIQKTSKATSSTPFSSQDSKRIYIPLRIHCQNQRNPKPR